MENYLKIQVPKSQTGLVLSESKVFFQIELCALLVEESQCCDWKIINLNSHNWVPKVALTMNIFSVVLWLASFYWAT